MRGQHRVPVAAGRAAAHARERRERRVAVEPLPVRPGPEITGAKCAAIVWELHKLRRRINPVWIISFIPVAVMPVVLSLHSGEFRHRIGKRRGHKRPGAVRFIAHTRSRARPSRVVENRHRPGRSQRAIRGHQHTGRRARGNEGRCGLLHRHTVGNSVHLRWKDRGECRGDVRSVGPDQRQVFSAAPELEARVQWRARHATVLARGEDQQIRIGQKIRARKPPLRQVRRLVGEKPSVEIDQVRAGVVDFDPIRRVTILIQHRAAVDRHELRDQQVIRAARQPATKENQRQQPGKNMADSHILDCCRFWERR